MENASILLGIDVSRDRLDLCLYEVRTDQSRFDQVANDEQAISDWLKDQSELQPEQTPVGLESTGSYHVAAARCFLSQGFPVKLLNPILTAGAVKATIRGKKTDQSDAELIVKLLLAGEGKALRLADLDNTEKELLRLSQGLIQTRVSYQQKLQELVRKQVPGTETAQLKLEELIASLNQTAQELTEEVTAVPSAEALLIDSIPGFAQKLSAVVWYEIGDITRFDNPAKLVAYAGLDPKIKASGTHQERRGRLTKRGSPYLRSALYLAANTARMHEPELKEYYEKKRAEGRSHKETLMIIARKLLYRIYAVLKRGTPYQKPDERQPSEEN